MTNVIISYAKKNEDDVVTKNLQFAFCFQTLNISILRDEKGMFRGKILGTTKKNFDFVNIKVQRGSTGIREVAMPVNWLRKYTLDGNVFIGFYSKVGD